MNIIQQQDNLKSLPEEVLIRYIENPMGEAPTFLVLGELERRKVMKDKYAAQQAEKPPVVEQIIDEAMPQSFMAQGIATGMAPPMAPPMAQEAGIAANPVYNVGQNYNAGGIVGMKAGGDPGYFSGMGEAVPSYLQSQDSILGQLQSDDSRTSKFYAAQAAQLADDRAKLTDNSERELYRALIRGGGVAAGSESPYALQGLSAGIGAGFESYNKGVDKLEEQENLIDKETRMLDAAKYSDTNAQATAFRNDYLKRLEIDERRRLAGLKAGEAADASALDLATFKLAAEKTAGEKIDSFTQKNILFLPGQDKQKIRLGLQEYMGALTVAKTLGKAEDLQRLLTNSGYGPEVMQAAEKLGALDEPRAFLQTRASTLFNELPKKP